MLAQIMQMGQEREPPPAILPEAAMMRLQEHQRRYAAWLRGVSQFQPGDTVTPRRDSPIGGHGMLFMVTEVDRFLPGSPSDVAMVGCHSEPPPRSRKTGLREDVRLAFIGRDEDSTVRNLWVEGWMLEPWSLEQAQQHAALEAASPTGPAQ